MKSKHILYFMTPAYGHFFCVLPIIRGLVAQGHEVECYSTREFAEYIENCGAHFVEYQMDFSALSISAATVDLFELMKTLMKFNREAFLIYEERFRTNPPDLLIYDSMDSFAKNLAHKYKVPSTCTVATLGFNFFVCAFSRIGISSILLLFRNFPSFIKLLWEEKRFRKQHGLLRFRIIDFYMNRADETIVLTPPELQPFAKTFGRHVHFVGTTIKDQIPMLHGDEKYASYDLFLSMGTVFSDRVEDFYELFQYDEFRDLHCLVISPNKPTRAFPENIEFRNWVSQLDLLPHCKLTMNQAGANSVYAAMYFGIPQICIPYQEEERQMAVMVRKFHCGIYLRRYDATRIRKAWQQVLGLSVKKCQQLLRRYDGTQLALNIISEQLK